MKFDLIEAMKRLQDEFGDDGDMVLIPRVGVGYEVRLRSFRCHEVHTVSFIISKTEESNNEWRILNREFDKAIRNLKAHVDLQMRAAGALFQN